MERKFKKSISSLSSIFDFFSEFIDRYAINPKSVFALNLAIEELFTNIIKYSSTFSEDVKIHLIKEPTQVIVHIIDKSQTPFDITQLPNVDTSQPIEERKIGGLGIHLVTKMVDKIDYKFEDTLSVITLVKNLD